MFWLGIGILCSIACWLALFREGVTWYKAIVWGATPILATMFLGLWGVPIGALFAAALWKLDLSRL